LVWISPTDSHFVWSSPTDGCFCLRLPTDEKKSYTVTHRKLFLFQFHPQMNVLLVIHPQNPVFVRVYPQKVTSLLKHPQMSKKSFYSPIYKIEPFNFIPVQIRPYPGAFRELDEVCSEVPENSRVLRVCRLWFPTSDRLQTWLIPPGTTWCRQCGESTIFWRNLPSYHRFWYFVLSFSSKRAWQSGSKHYQRWYEGRSSQTMVDSWCCLDRIVPERMSQVSRRSEVGINGALF